MHHHVKIHLEIWHSDGIDKDLVQLLYNKINVACLLDPGPYGEWLHTSDLAIDLASPTSHQSPQTPMSSTGLFKPNVLGFSNLPWTGRNDRSQTMA